MIFLIGGTGLVGSAFLKYLKKNKFSYKLITRKNKIRFYNKSCDILIDCNGNGSKRLGTLDPFFDFNASVTSVAENLMKIKFKKYIYISSVFTYSNLVNKNFTKESIKTNYETLIPYGFNKLIAEFYVKKYSKKYLILRLPYIVGPGLKRNPVYDLSHNMQTFINLNSEINCIHTDTIANITMKLIKKNTNNEIFNLGAKDTIKIQEIVDICKLKKYQLKKTKRTDEKTKINCSKISKIINLPTSKSQVKKYLEDIKYF